MNKQVTVIVHPDGNVEVNSNTEDKIERLGILQAGIISVVFGQPARSGVIATPDRNGRF